MLACTNTCQLSTEGCYKCGDGLAEGPEECDGNDIPSSCADLGFADGELKCTGECTFDESLCCKGPQAPCVDASECCSQTCNAQACG